MCYIYNHRISNVTNLKNYKFSINIKLIDNRNTRNVSNLMLTNVAYMFILIWMLHFKSKVRNVTKIKENAQQILVIFHCIFLPSFIFSSGFKLLSFTNILKLVIFGSKLTDFYLKNKNIFLSLTILPFCILAKLPF